MTDTSLHPTKVNHVEQHFECGCVHARRDLGGTRVELWIVCQCDHHQEMMDGPIARAVRAATR